MKMFITIVLSVTCVFAAFAQKASDVLEGGMPIKSGEKIYLQFNNQNILKYDLSRYITDLDFTSLPDSPILMPRKNAVNMILWPYNPLNISVKTSSKVFADPINEAALSALTGIISSLPDLSIFKQSTGAESFINQEKASNNNSDCSVDKLNSKLNIIRQSLSVDQKIPIANIFTRLTKLDFSSERPTDSLSKINVDIEKIATTFETINANINNLREEIKRFNCPDTASPFVGKYIFNQILDQVTVVYKERRKRLLNLKIARDLIESQANNYTKLGDPKGNQLDEVVAKEGNISIYSITFKQGPLVLDDQLEIVSREPEEILSKTIRIRKFQRFVPEVSVGTAFTFLKYNTYGTTSDSTGQQYVGTPTENKLRNLNIAAMLNLNYFIENSILHPFYQIGAGVNSGVPTLLTGFGLRSSINGLKRLALSGGVAMSWIRVLDKLKVGDRVSGTDDIEKDLKTEFSWPPKPYIGIQFNF